MKKIMSQEYLTIIARVVEEEIYVPKNQKKVTIFLCGADINDSSTGRHKMAALLSKYPRFEIHYPEDLFDDLLAGQAQHSLLSLENILAESVDAILLFPESPGSFAELGAFANNVNLAEKLICIQQKKYKNKKSFINFGPNRQIKQSKSGKVIHVNYASFDEANEADKLYKRINDEITKIKKNHPVKKNIGNIIESEYFLLPCIYLMETINIVSLSHILQTIIKKDVKLCEIATKCALGRLVAKRLITRSPSGYAVTDLGVERVRKDFNNSNLDRARLEIMNFEMRKNSSIRHDRMTNAHL